MAVGVHGPGLVGVVIAAASLGAAGVGTSGLAASGGALVGRSLQQAPGPSLISAVLVADASEGSGAEVRIAYVIMVPAGVDAIPLTVLVPEPAVVWGVEAQGTGVLSVDLPPSSTAQRAGVIRLQPADGARELEVALTYAVDDATVETGDRLRVLVPVLAVDWPPADALPGTFQARIQLPLDVVAYEAFPTALNGLARAGTDPGPSLLELSVLPAYVSLRASRGPPPLLTVPRVVDAFVVVLLLVLGLVGWRKMGLSLKAADR